MHGIFPFWANLVPEPQFEQSNAWLLSIGRFRQSRGSRITPGTQRAGGGIVTRLVRSGIISAPLPLRFATGRCATHRDNEPHLRFGRAPKSLRDAARCFATRRDNILSASLRDNKERVKFNSPSIPLRFAPGRLRRSPPGVAQSPRPPNAGFARLKWEVSARYGGCEEGNCF